MKKLAIIKTCVLLLIMVCVFNIRAQETDEDVNSLVNIQNKKGFHIGLYVGSYFANKYTANLYDGYGFDIDGNRNNFENSFMNQKIVYQYGGNASYSGLPDQIAQALSIGGLNINHTDWTFSESDMPTNMRYTPAFLIGLNTRYAVDTKNAILINVNAAKLTITGNFTIVTNQQSQSSQINDRIKTFAIRGGEQRLLMQFGYQHIFGDNEKINFIAEAGLNVTLAKFDKNEVLINSLKIDLISYNNTAYYATTGPVKKPIGFGYGLFGGVGANITMSPKWTIQLLYNPTYENIRIVANPKLKLQNSIGLRAYYML